VTLPAFRAGSSAQTASATTVALTWPTGTAQGDVVFLMTSCDNATDITVSTNALDWALVTGADQSDGSTFRAKLFWRRFTTGDGAPTVQNTARTSTQHFRGALWAYRGCVPSGDPWEGLVIDADLTTPFRRADITTTGPDRLALCLIAYGDDSATAPPAGGWVEDAEYLSNTGLDGGSIADSLSVTTAQTVTGSATHRSPATSAVWMTVSMALKPATSFPPYLPNRAFNHMMVR